MYFSCTITSLFVWEGKAKEKSLFSFSLLFRFCQRLFVLWRPVLMYVRSLLFDNKPDFYFVSCTLYLCFFISSRRPNKHSQAFFLKRLKVAGRQLSLPQVQVSEYHTDDVLLWGTCTRVFLFYNTLWFCWAPFQPQVHWCV